VTAIRHLELHVTHGCNLTCESCSHYSNQGHMGHLSLTDADAWMGAWSSRIPLKVFSLLGGEPTIHPELPAFLTLARRHWPDAVIRIVSNGFFLHRHPSLPAAMREAGNVGLYVSIHHPSSEYFKKVQPNLQLAKSWQRDYGINLKVYRSAEMWTRRYLGSGADMQPYRDQRPRESWEHCVARHSPQLFEGRIWKCAPLAYLGMQHAKYGLSEDWSHYLGYQPLAADCDDAELNAFLALEEESYCGMCPASPDSFELPLPFPKARTRSNDA